MKSQNLNSQLLALPGHRVFRPTIHSDFIWIFQIFSLKFSDWNSDKLTQNSDFFGIEFGGEFYIKVLFGGQIQILICIFRVFLTFIQILCQMKVAGLRICYLFFSRFQNPVAHLNKGGGCPDMAIFFGVRVSITRF